MSWILRDYGGFLDFFPVLDECKDAPDKDECIGKESVLRLTGATFVFFLCHAISLIKLRDNLDPRRYLHNSCWIIQVAAWIGLVVIAFLLPNDVFLVGPCS